MEPKEKVYVSWEEEQEEILAMLEEDGDGGFANEFDGLSDDELDIVLKDLAMEIE